MTKYLDDRSKDVKKMLELTGQLSEAVTAFETKAAPLRLQLPISCYHCRHCRTGDHSAGAVRG